MCCVWSALNQTLVHFPHNAVCLGREEHEELDLAVDNKTTGMSEVASVQFQANWLADLFNQVNQKQ